VTDQRVALGRGEHRVQQFEEAILTQAQVVVQRLTEVTQPLPRIGFLHTPSLARFSPNRKTLRLPGPVRCLKSS
jgi:hypothetical protein